MFRAENVCFRNKRFTGKRWAVAGAAALALVMVLSGCGQNGGSGTQGNEVSRVSEPAAGFPEDYKGEYPMPLPDKAYNNPQPYNKVRDGGSLTLVEDYAPNWNLYSTDGNTGAMSNMWQWYMPNLYCLDVKGNLTWNPDYVTNVELTSRKPMVVTIDINSKAKWNDGTPIDWTAFEANWKLMNGKDPIYNPASTQGVEDIESVKQGKNAKGAVITFSKPYYPWQQLFSGLANPKALDRETYAKGWIDNPHAEWAAGPFKPVKVNKDETVFERNPSWWGRKPKLSKVTFKHMESSASFNAFKNGELDAVNFSSANDLKTAKTVKGIQIRLGYSSSIGVFTYNATAGALKDINVRKAITFGLDTKTLASIANQGLNWTVPTPGSELFPVFQEGYEDNRPAAVKKGLDKEAAKKALVASGYKLGSDGYYTKAGKRLELRYTYFGDSAGTVAAAKAYSQMMKAVGVKINLDPHSSADFADVLNGGDYDVLPMSWVVTDPYGQTALMQLYGSKSDSNYTHIGNAEIDRLAKRPSTIEGQLKAVVEANKAEKAALNLYGTMPYQASPSFTAVKKGLANWGPHGLQTLDPTLVGWGK
ncbi:ABC transporter family substrate-binding protein [Bifidobacterium bombi]|uniref:Oligopeptide ABC transporter, substrate-binding protein OppA n=1 Tax=Bifidobacterium bombi DSM 19703 TaxID=1341695 RepID=A0A086BP55_9BIFI|nr:ABC transporter family substrate-binding protein [Bifidobacterium bombi]KFF30719.1 oligopeptide ABC transporter, substrate-binding protein OppA [Bifidobacterium bombi DSM 19703]